MQQNGRKLLIHPRTDDHHPNKCVCVCVCVQKERKERNTPEKEQHLMAIFCLNLKFNHANHLIERAYWPLRIDLLDWPNHRLIHLKSFFRCQSNTTHTCTVIVSSFWSARFQSGNEKYSFDFFGFSVE